MYIYCLLVSEHLPYFLAWTLLFLWDGRPNMVVGLVALVFFFSHEWRITPDEATHCSKCGTKKYEQNCKTKSLVQTTEIIVTISVSHPRTQQYSYQSKEADHRRCSRHLWNVFFLHFVSFGRETTCTVAKHFYSYVFQVQNVHSVSGRSPLRYIVQFCAA